MSPQEFAAAAAGLNRLIRHDIYVIVGQEGINHFKRSFQRDQQGFIDDILESWPELSPERQKQKPAGKPILTDSSNLHDSLTYKAEPSQGVVRFQTDVSYAQRHNEGLNGMPQRQFMGPSKALDRKIKAKIDREIRKHLGR